MTPAQHVLTKLGAGDLNAGIALASEILSLHSTSVFRWTRPKDKGRTGRIKGSGGLIPTNRMQALIEGARSKGIDLTPADFFAGVAA